MINHKAIGTFFVVLSLLSVTEAKEPDKKITIGISLPTQREEHWVRDAKKMQDTGQASGKIPD